MEIIYSFKKCASCGLCISVLPDIWCWGPEGRARLRNPTEVSDQWEKGSYENLPKIETILANCPTGAIKLEE